MRNPEATTHDVLIAGAGLVGLLLACELRLAGCSVLVLEQAPDPRSPLKELPFGLRGLSVPTIESLDRRGLLEAVKDRAVSRDAPATAHWTRQQRRPAGHFAGIQFFEDQLELEQWPHRLPEPVGSMATTMASLEAVLNERASKLGVEIRRDCGVEAMDASDENVTVRAGGDIFRAGWLVGCDGGRSTVRKAAGFEFTGTDQEFTGYSVLAELADPDMLPPGRHYTTAGMYTYAPPGTIAMVDFDGGACHRTGPIAGDRVQTVLRRISGVKVTVRTLELAATWTDRAYQATRYRRGRVLLAGDAAHIHSPLGGQGLNLGLGDAMNLGWKLAATVHGDAAPDLLASYESERHPVGAQVLDWSRAQVALMRPSPSSRALEAIVRDLIDTRDGATYFAARVLGVSLRYDLGGNHPVVGRSAPNFFMADGTRLNDHLRDGRGLLLEFASTPALPVQADRWRDRFNFLRSGVEESLGLAALLIRPDGIVVWTAGAGIDDGGFALAASRWFGAAAHAAARASSSQGLDQ